MPNSDLIPGVYEGVHLLDLLYFFFLFLCFLLLFMIRFVFWDAGGLKLWEGSLDLINALQAEVRNGHLSFSGKRVLEVGT